ncbi:hypothetical protein FSP39_012582 [Pinctada imbricata]|uniref:ATP-dependent DNA helicase n=1 Tax=Pinctada imbricata TaxID=66713 RepID=A0AA88YTK4_PINIB|nr:hypothetical protein FSP39_012582 [Pinctada imbricata]
MFTDTKLRQAEDVRTIKEKSRNTPKNSAKFVESETIDDRQMKAQDLALRGHNIVITGQGGTGKTFLIKQLCKDQSKKGTSYAVTSTTGLGATLFGRATTIHKFIGLEDGRHQNNQFLHVLCQSCNNEDNITASLTNLSEYIE